MPENYNVEIKRIIPEKTRSSIKPCINTFGLTMDSNWRKLEPISINLPNIETPSGTEIKLENKKENFKKD